MTLRESWLGEGAARVPVRVFADARELGVRLAGEILAAVRTAGLAGRPFILGCPGGRSLKSTYGAMGEAAGREGADLSRLVIAMMDDYVVRGPQGFSYCDAGAHYSCRRFAREEIQAVLNAGLPPDRRIPGSGVWFPDPGDPEAYDARLTGAGGVDVFLIASGATDGHVAFNPPGSPADAPSRIVPLADTTREDNMATFPDFRSKDDVPGFGVTVGLGTIRRQSRRVVLVVHGADKRNAARRLGACRDFDAGWPASIVFRCRQARVYMDAEAAGAMEEGVCRGN